MARGKMMARLGTEHGYHFVVLLLTTANQEFHHSRRRLCSQELLDACGRSHDLSEVREAIRVVRASGVRSWSLDLISGLPNLDMARWRHSLQEAIRAGPNHISVYDLQVCELGGRGIAGFGRLRGGLLRSQHSRRGLSGCAAEGSLKMWPTSLAQVEEGTPFARWYDQGKLSFPVEDDAATMYAEAVSLLTAAGYEHYEVSAAALAPCSSPRSSSAEGQDSWRGLHPSESRLLAS